MALQKDFGFGPNKDIKYLEDYVKNYFDSKLNIMYPVGAIVILMDSAKKNPAALGYPGTWTLVGAGRTLVCRGTSGTWDVNPGTPGGNSSSANHTHAIYATEVINEDIPNPEWLDDRRIYADVLDGNSDQCDQNASTGPCYRYLLHSDDDMQGTPTNGSYQLIKTFENYVWATPHDPQSQVGYANPIEASRYGGGSSEDPGSNYPPYIAVNIWKRTA